MGDEQHGAAKTTEGFFEPGNGTDVQVVGRLVKQQQIRLGHQRLSEQHTSAPATGELGQGLVGRQLQAAQGAVDQLLQAPAVTRFQVVLDVHEFFQVSITVDVLTQVMILSKQGADTVEAFGHYVEHGTTVGHRQFLRQLANLQPRSTPDIAVVRLLIALDQTQHARLASTVAANNAHPLTTGDLPRHLVQQRHGAERKGHIA
ncbi:hypothetical protein D3C79_661360 [compost metagenome]